MFVPGDWLTSAPPLFRPAGPTTGVATMATAGCSNGHCECLSGVGGILCDRCLPEFWGFNLIGGGGGGARGAVGCTREQACILKFRLRELISCF